MTGSKKYCVIHGHFYQPPRESPWFEDIQRQPSAAPYHNWNERIYDECYRANAFSRILDEEGQITGVSNNYSYMSFNFGPTLFQWLSQKQPEAYQRVVDADKRSCEMYDGHGSAVAQVYNHIIMPHASRKDQLTQIRWANSFFKRHFGRDPEGMWLAETAINMVTVECLIEEGIKFVILSPNQADAFRFLEESTHLKKSTHTEESKHWIYADDVGLDPRFPYRTYVEDEKGHKNEKKYLDIFFFDEPLSRAISFENMLDNADILAGRINNCYTPESDENEIVTIATDGETFGHHKKHGDMCLAYFFRNKAKECGIEVVNLAYYLAKNPPQREVKLKNRHGEGTAWSCAHGTGRWIRDCGCNTGGLEGWNQKWRGPLREAMEYLQFEIDMVYEREMIRYFNSPWEIRDLYEPYLYDSDGAAAFIKESADRSIPDNKIIYIHSLLEAQKYILYGYTSCAWFFNDIAGIETVQNIRYALRAWQLTWPGEVRNDKLDRFAQILDEGKSNLPDQTGKTILKDDAMPMFYHLERAAFTAAVNNYIYEDSSDYNLISYTIMIDRYAHRHFEHKEWQLFDISVTHVSSKEKKQLILALFNNRGKNIEGAIFPYKMKSELEDEKSSFNYLMATKATLTLTLKDVFEPYRDIFTKQFVDDFAKDTLLDYISWAGIHSSRLDAITELNGGLPEELAGTVAFFINKEWEIHIMQLVKQKASEGLTASLEEVIRKAKYYGIEIDKSSSGDYFHNSLQADMASLSEECPQKLTQAIHKQLDIVERFTIPVRYSQLQDHFYLFYRKIAKGLYKEWVKEGRQRNSVRDAITRVNSLAERFGYSTEKTAL